MCTSNDVYPTKKHQREARIVKNACTNCGKKHPQIIFHDGKWYCPGACNVTLRKKKT